MDEKISLEAIALYADAYADKVLKNFFASKDKITGKEILSCCNVQQANLFIIRELFKTWREDTRKFKSPYFDFEPEDIHSMDTLGTLYSRMRVSDNWGKLTVDKVGCLVSNNFRYLRITARGFKVDKNRFEGEGWHLLLNTEWELVPVDQNYFVRRLIP